MEQRTLTVTELNSYLKARMDSDPMLTRVCVAGEISNYKVYPSGHHYFTLKDAGGALSCTMFRSNAARLRFRPENGMQVFATGSVSVYLRDGRYQLNCTALSPVGVGDLYVAFEQLKQKLAAEGLFDPERKQPLPRYPHRIAIITSSAGAAVHDMLRILRKRYPLSKVLLLPVRVQGAEAPPEICGAIRYANRWQLADVIITGRGGGSIEDLWAFNDERVARAISASEIPVVSAVGHEPDVTISDFVADLRAATPSNAAELVAPDQMELRQALSQSLARMQAAMTRRLQLHRQRLQTLSQARVLQSPAGYLQERQLRLDADAQRLRAAMRQLIAARKQLFVRRAASLDALSPLKVLGRGYSLTLHDNGTPVRSVRELHPGDHVTLRLHDGTARAEIQEEIP